MNLARFGQNISEVIEQNNTSTTRLVAILGLIAAGVAGAAAFGAAVYQGGSARQLQCTTIRLEQQEKRREKCNLLNAKVSAVQASEFIRDQGWAVPHAAAKAAALVLLEQPPFDGISKDVFEALSTAIDSDKVPKATQEEAEKFYREVYFPSLRPAATSAFEACDGWAENVEPLLPEDCRQKPDNQKGRK